MTIARSAIVVALLVAGVKNPAWAEEDLSLRREGFLVDASIGFGIEPQSRTRFQCDKTVQSSGNPDTSQPLPQCNQVLAFGIGGELLWHGFAGIALGLYAAEGSPVQVSGNDAQGRPLPSFGNRISVAAALVVRPLVPLAWRFGGRYLARLAAGLGVQAGASIEYARTSLDSAANVGFHLQGYLDVPLYGANTSAGVALRLSARLLVSPEARFLPQPQGNYQVDQPGTAAQLFAGIAFYR